MPETIAKIIDMAFLTGLVFIWISCVSDKHSSEAALFSIFGWILLGASFLFRIGDTLQ